MSINKKRMQELLGIMDKALGELGHEVEMLPEDNKPIPTPAVPADQPTCLAIVVGHDVKAQGAVGVGALKGVTEYEYNKDLAVQIREKLSQLDSNDQCEIFLRDGVGITGAYKNALEWIGKQGKPACLIELHYNAFKPGHTVQGTETLYNDEKDQSGLDERIFATMVQKEMCAAFSRSGKQDRGTKTVSATEQERGWQNLTRTIAYPSVLIEPFFGDQEQDAKLAVERKGALAVGIAKAFVDFMRK